MNIVPCLTWVRRGVAKSMPEKVQLSKEELKKIIEETQDAIDNADDKEWSDTDSDDQSDVDVTTEGAAALKHKTEKQKPVKLGKRQKAADEEEMLDDETNIVKKYGLDDYDGNEEDCVNPLQGIGKLSYYSTNDDDPYITLKDDDSDTEDYEIKASDNLVVIGRAQEDACSMEVHVYNEQSGSLYVHHDILLPSFPLALEWLNYDPADGKPGNFVAVGTMLPNIDIWDLDLVDCLEPVATLHGKVNKKSAKKKGSSVGHTDAVLDLSWNSALRNVLASASADSTIGLWDLTEEKIATCLKHHTDKVQCVAWHPFEAQSLLSGSFDHTVRVYDCRTAEAAHKSWNLHGEIERVRWNHFSPFRFLASTDKGMVYCVDVRTDKPVYTLSAHSEAVPGLCLSSEVADMLVTASSDQTLKVWDTHDDKPSLVLEKNLKMNELHCLGCCPEAPYVFAMGGGSQLKVWDIRESAAVQKHFEDRILGSADSVKVENTPHKEMDDFTANAMETLDLGASHTDKKKTKKKKKKTKKTK